MANQECEHHLECVERLREAKNRWRFVAISAIVTAVLLTISGAGAIILKGDRVQQLLDLDKALIEGERRKIETLEQDLEKARKQLQEQGNKTKP